MNKILKYANLATLAASCGAVAWGQVYDLTEQSFDNPEFQKRFAQSYLANSETSPSITAEEKKLFDEIVPLIQNEPKQAIQKLQSSISTESSAAFDFILGNLLYQEGDTPASINSYRTAIKKFPNYPTAYYNAGRALIASENYQEGLKSLQKSMELQPGDGTMYGLIGYCYLNLEKPSTALDAYRNAIMLDSDSRDWKLGKLQCLIALDKPEEAIGMLYELIADEPSNPDWWKLQANQFVALGQSKKAAVNLEIVRTMSESDGASLSLLGDLYLNEGLIQEALDCYSTALDQGGVQPRRAIEVASSLAYMDHIEKAKGLANRIEKAFGDDLSEPQELEFLNLRARLAMREEDTEAAAEFLEQVVHRDPLNGNALLTLAELEKSRGNLAKAEFHAENASKVGAFAHRAHLALAQLAVEKRDYKVAAKHLRQAQQIKPMDYVADYLLRIEQAAIRM